MGRTRRKRLKKAPRKMSYCEHEDNLIALNVWLNSRGLIRNKKLTLSVFDNTGRGVLTKQKIYPGEELMNMPISLTINVITLLTDRDFQDIFMKNKQDCFQKYNKTLSFQALMSFYLVYHRSLGSRSKWCVYLENLPKSYTVPYFLPKEIQDILDPSISSVVMKQKANIQSSFLIFKEIVKTCLDTSIVNVFNMFFTLSHYEWAYFTVNTRCVYMDLSKLIDFRLSEFTLISLLNSDTKISLCPYLDMINHSPKARNETKLLLNKNTNAISVKNITEDNFCDLRFSIYTKNIFDPYTEIFICYGDSYNLKLLTEYGFILPSIDLDYVTFEYDAVVQKLEKEGLKLSQEQISFINSHGLKKDLYIDMKGLSFNLYGLLMVVKYFYKENINVSRVIYSSMDIYSDNSVKEIISKTVSDKCLVVKNLISNLENCDSDCTTLNMCIELMCNYVKILEKFIEC